MKVINFFFVVCVGVLVVCCVLVNLFFRLYISCKGKPLFLAIVHMVFHSCCFAWSVMGVDKNLCRCTPQGFAVMDGWM